MRCRRATRAAKRRTLIHESLKRTSKQVTIQIAITRSPENTVVPPTPNIDFKPNIPASLVPTEAREVYALVTRMNSTYTGNKAKKPEMATSRRCARKVFIRLSLDSFSHSGILRPFQQYGFAN